MRVRTGTLLAGVLSSLSLVVLSGAPAFAGVPGTVDSNVHCVSGDCSASIYSQTVTWTPPTAGSDGTGTTLTRINSAKAAYCFWKAASAIADINAVGWAWTIAGPGFPQTINPITGNGYYEKFCKDEAGVISQPFVVIDFPAPPPAVPQPPSVFVQEQMALDKIQWVPAALNMDPADPFAQTINLPTWLSLQNRAPLVATAAIPAVGAVTVTLTPAGLWFKPNDGVTDAIVCDNLGGPWVYGADANPALAPGYNCWYRFTTISDAGDGLFQYQSAILYHAHFEGLFGPPGGVADVEPILSPASNFNTQVHERPIFNQRKAG